MRPRRRESLRESLGESLDDSLNEPSKRHVSKSRKVADRFGLVILAVAVVFVVSGCGEEPVEAFTLDNKEGFMTACVDSELDSELLTAVCGCVIEELESYEYEEFESLDAALIENPEAQLPAAVTDVVADCFIEAAEL